MGSTGAKNADTFPKFNKMPKELRERIYGFVLAVDGPIAPQLCDKDPIQFHNQRPTDSGKPAAHNAIHEQMTITRASRQLRAESLPVFYSVNTTIMCADLGTYLTRLEHLGRLHLLRNVVFPVHPHHESQVTKALGNLVQNIHVQNEYEKYIVQRNSIIKTTLVGSSSGPSSSTQTADAPIKPDLSRFYAFVREDLMRHPQYIAGGLEWLSTFLVLRQLAAVFSAPTTTTTPTTNNNTTSPPSSSPSSSSSQYAHIIVLYVPHAAFLPNYRNLENFRDVCHCLGIKLDYVEGRHAKLRLPGNAGRGLVLSWARKDQKAEYSGQRSAQTDIEEAARRFETVFPGVEGMPRPERFAYMRHSCDGSRMQWWTVENAGLGAGQEQGVTTAFV